MNAGTEARAAAVASASAIDAIVTHHRDGFRSGVARFNELLAQKLGVPLHGLDDPAVEGTSCALLSFKVDEMTDAEQETLARLLERIDWHGDVYLHRFEHLPLELEILRRARRVHCGNLEIQEAVSGLAADVRVVWTPSLVLDRREYAPTELSVFSFGMAHKIRTDMFARLRDLLERSGRTYAVYVSAANHETASLRDAQAVFEEMHAIFPRLYFLGNLSDVAVHNELLRTTFFAAFFPGGVRANNTSVAAAMEQGAVVITNLDRHSPRELVHMETVIDLEQCDELPSDPLVLRRIGVNAMEAARARSWEALAAQLRT